MKCPARFSGSKQPNTFLRSAAVLICLGFVFGTCLDFVLDPTLLQANPMMRGSPFRIISFVQPPSSGFEKMSLQVQSKLQFKEVNQTHQSLKLHNVCNCSDSIGSTKETAQANPMLAQSLHRWVMHTGKRADMDLLYALNDSMTGNQRKEHADEYEPLRLGMLAAAEVPDTFQDYAQVWEQLSHAKVLRPKLLGHQLLALTHNRDTFTEVHVLPGLAEDEYKICHFLKGTR